MYEEYNSESFGVIQNDIDLDTNFGDLRTIATFSCILASYSQVIVLGLALVS